MVLVRDVDQVVAHFGPFGDRVNLDARWVHGLRRTTIGSEIVLGTTDGTPRSNGLSESLYWSIWRKC
jgi:hypothetical protein